MNNKYPFKGCPLDETIENPITEENADVIIKHVLFLHKVFPSFISNPKIKVLMDSCYGIHKPRAWNIKEYFIAYKLIIKFIWVSWYKKC